MTETWRPIAGWSYDVSNLGRVRSVRGAVLRCRDVTHNGYARVELYRGGRRHRFRVHVLVLEAFVGPRPSGMQAAHIDGDPSNNHASNLRWCSPRDNAADRRRHGREPHGERNGRATITADVVRRLRAYRGSHADAADDVGSTYSVAHKVRTGRSWRHV
jgi:hypothetical protein